MMSKRFNISTLGGDENQIIMKTEKYDFNEG